MAKHKPSRKEFTKDSKEKTEIPTDLLIQENVDLKFKLQKLPGLEKRNSELENLTKELNSSIANLKKEFNQSKSSNESLNDTNRELENKINLHEIEIKRIHIEKTQLEEQLNIYKTNYVELLKVKDALNISNKNYLDQIVQYQTELDEVKKIILQNEQLYKSQIESRDEAIKAVEEDLKYKRKRIRNLDEDRDRLSHNNQVLLQEKDKLKVELEEIKRERETLNSSLEVLRLEKTKYEVRQQEIKQILLMDTVEKFGEIFVRFAEQPRRIDPKQLKKAFEIAFNKLSLNKVLMFPPKTENNILLDLANDTLPSLLQKFDWTPYHPFEGERKDQAIHFRILRRGLMVNGQVLLRAIVTPISTDNGSILGEANE